MDFASFSLALLIFIWFLSICLIFWLWCLFEPPLLALPLPLLVSLQLPSSLLVVLLLDGGGSTVKRRAYHRGNCLGGLLKPYEPGPFCTHLYQDNKSTILLEENDKRSSSRRTRHFNIRYFYLTD